MTTKEEVKALWQQCFDDSDAFVELYFEHRYTDERNVAIKRNGKIVSALQLIPYQMTYCGKAIPVSYISGACTHPGYRKQGLMSCLLADAHRRMYAEGVWMGMLIPVSNDLFEYYAKSGYASVFHDDIQKVDTRFVHLSPLYTITDELEDDSCLWEHYHYLSTCMEKRPCGVLHSREDFQVIMDDLRLDRGRLLVARRGGLIHGMAFCVKAGERLLVKELLADNQAINDSLLKKASMLWGIDEVDCLTPSLQDVHRLGMARIINAENMLKLFARKYPEKEMYLQLKDEVIPENNGYYLIDKGNCLREHCPDKVCQVWHVNELTSLLLESEHPYMSLMLN